MATEAEDAKALVIASRSRHTQFEAAVEATDVFERVDQEAKDYFHNIATLVDEWETAARWQLRQAQGQNQKKLGAQEGRLASTLTHARISTRSALLPTAQGHRSLPQLTRKLHALGTLACTQAEARVPAFRVTASLPTQLHPVVCSPVGRSLAPEGIPQMVRVWMYEIPGSVGDLQKRLPPHGQAGRMGRRGRREGHGEMEMPCGIAVHPQTQELYVVDTNLSRVLVFGGDLTYRRFVGRYGHGPGQLNGPTGVAWSADGETMAIVESRSHRVHLYNRQEQFVRLLGSVKGADAGLFNYPTYVAFEPTPGGAFYVADQYNHRVQKFAPDGSVLAVFPMPAAPDPRQKVMAVAVVLAVQGEDPESQPHVEPVLLVSDFAGESVRLVDAMTGRVLTAFQTPACSAWTCVAPGPEGTFLLSATNENMVHVLSCKDGALLLSFAAQNPVGMGFDADGRLFVVESARACVAVY